jgi:hypothetical protein
VYNEILVGDAVIFMKVGTHATESLADIVARKQDEIETAGLSMWGYGGNTCHPRTMVQPFVDTYARSDRPIRLVMQPMASRHFADPVRAEEFSPDGVHWERIPDGINVLGSRFALCVSDIRPADERLDLGQTQVAIGRSQGRLGTDYLQGQADKACLQVVKGVEPTADSENAVDIGLMADLVHPYAVFLRNSGEGAVVR